jgi:hypothetical protein
MTIDKHTLALISIAGSSLDVLGALYLAYDLLGGEHGPLRTLTRGVTYGALFGGGYTLALGPVFGIATGVTHGATLAWEFASAARHDAKPGLWHDAAMSGLRGLGFAIGAGYLYGPIFGAVFGLLSAVGQTVAYQFGIRPTLDYKPGSHLRISKLQLLAAVNRTAGYGISGYLSALAAQHADALSVGLRVGLSTGLVTVVVNACFPWIEWMADRMPQKTMGVLGIGLILVGFALQSVQYWVAFLDVTVR